MKFNTFASVVFITQIVALVVQAAPLKSEPVKIDQIKHKTCQIALKYGDFETFGMAAKGYKKAQYPMATYTGRIAYIPVDMSKLTNSEPVVRTKLESLNFKSFPQIRMYTPAGERILPQVEEFRSHVMSFDFDLWPVDNKQNFYFEIAVEITAPEISKIDERGSTVWTYFNFKPVYTKVVYKSPVTSFQTLAQEIIRKDPRSSEGDSLKIIAQGQRLGDGQEDTGEPMMRLGFLLEKAGYISDEKKMEQALAAGVPNCVVDEAAAE